MRVEKGRKPVALLSFSRECEHLGDSNFSVLSALSSNYCKYAMNTDLGVTNACMQVCNEHGFGGYKCILASR